MQIRPSIYPLIGRAFTKPAASGPSVEPDGPPLVLSLPPRVDVVTMFSIEGLLTGHVLLDRYQVGEVLGRGGMGIVYRARDLKLDRDVALKVLTAASPDAEEHAELRSRLAREARIAAGIKHPNVVAVYDHGNDPALGLDFLTMELLEGEDLATRLRRVGLPRLRSALGVIREAAAGLAAGHRAGLVHRDVKPGNIFLESSDTDPGNRVKILDFGIAKGTLDADLTQTHAAGGSGLPLTPAFASPEQLRGGEWLSPASDVFSLGTVAFHLLTGRRAFSSFDGEQTMREVAESLAALKDDGGLPPSLVRVLEQALSPFPEERFADAGAFLRALDSIDDRDLGHPERLPLAVSIDNMAESDSAAPPYAAAIAGYEPARSTEGAAEQHRRRSRAIDGLSIVLLLGAWAFGAGGLMGARGSVIAALAASAVLAPWLVVRINGRTESLRFAILATLAVTLLALAVIGGSLPTLPAFAGIGAAQLAMAALASWLSSGRSMVVDAEYEVISPRTDAW
ncbi:MAG: serine/threonine-protein kinase [Gemmatimonadota bacterium]